MDIERVKEIFEEAYLMIKNPDLELHHTDDPNTLIDWLLRLNQYQPTLTNALSWSKGQLRNEEMIVALKYKEKETATVLKYLIGGETTEIATLVDALEELVKDNKRAIESIRTMISLRKAEMENLRFTPEQT